MTVSVGPSLVSAIGIPAVNGAASLSAPGLKVGDVVIKVTLHYANGSANYGDPPGSSVEAVVSVADEIQQIGGNLAGGTIDVFMVRLP